MRRVLVLERHGATREATTHALETHGASVYSTDDSSCAIEQIDSAHPPEVAIVDASFLDARPGQRVLEALRAGARRGIAIVISAHPGRRTAAAALGFRTISRPARRSALLTEVGRALGNEVVPPALPAGTTPRRAEFGPLRILLADDNSVNRRVAEQILRRLGLQATTVVNGREAVEAVRAHAYDLLFLDVQMPEMDGHEAARMIVCEAGDGPRPWIIAMTANAIVGDRDACLAAGMDDYVAKPVRIEDLEAALRRAQIRPRVAN